MTGQEREAVVGIDLGTTNTVVACVRGESVAVVPYARGSRLIPSVVAFPPRGGALVGAPARDRRVIDPANTITSAKRLIGQAFRAPAVQELIGHLPYKVAEGDNQECLIVTRAGSHRVADISGMVLTYAKTLAEQFLGCAVRRCVVTVPANFSDAQRQATRQAAARAGLEVLRILNEPTAAALAYGAGRELHQRIAVFDLGGGTFDLTLLAVRGEIFAVVATGGDPFLGGDDMDRALALRLAEQFLRQHRVDLTATPEGMGKLIEAAEHIKVRLSSEEVVEEIIPELAYGEGGAALDMQVRITRSEFEQIIAPFVERALVCARRVLGEAQVSPADVDEIVLAGGGTRVPLVRQQVEQLFGRPPLADINPMGVVAAGAALHAALLATPPEEERKGVGFLMDVTSHALGIATAGGFAEPLVAKNTPIPAERGRVFSTARDGQTAVRIRVCQGAARRFDANTRIGELRLDGLRSAPRGEVKIQVEFLVDANGLLSVTARDLETGRATQATLSILGVGRS
jgi:molecular chaperone DnaK